jgi:surface antigen
MATASVKGKSADTALVAGVDPSDWAAVRQALAKTPVPGREIAWSNPVTGSSGTVALGATLAKAGSACRSLAAIVNDIRGIRFYRGEACRERAGVWRLSAIVPDDRALL